MVTSACVTTILLPGSGKSVLRPFYSGKNNNLDGADRGSCWTPDNSFLAPFLRIGEPSAPLLDSSYTISPAP